MQVIKASTGKILTDGESYGKVIFLADGADAKKFHEVTDEEYQEILKKQEEENANFI